MAVKRITYEMEFIFKASPAILYQFLTSPDCLVRWFCDVVDINDDVFSFEWDGSQEDWEMIDDIQEERIRFGMEDADPDEYIEFRMYKSDVTNETILEITAFCDSDEEEEERTYWENQLKQLRVVCGG